MKTEAMKHQLQALERSEGKRNFGYLMEQGTGKTWTTLADVERCFMADKVGSFFICAPNGVHSNWTRREIPTHLGIDTLHYTWRGKPTSKREIAALESFLSTKEMPSKMRTLSMNVDAINSPVGFEVAERFLESGRVYFAMDESTRIKNPKAKRTEKVVELGRLAEARRILTGTPITKAPTDLFSQFDFLKPGLLGTKSYRAFVAEYSVLLEPNSPQMQAILRKLGGRVRGIPQVVKEDEFGNKMWKNLDKLSQLILPHSYRVKKEDCLDLPPKIYQTVYFELGTKQRQVYDRLAEDYHYIDQIAEDQFRNLSFEAIATRTKLKQVTSGFINIEGSPRLVNPDENPRLKLFKDIVEDIDGQFIVWAMFEEEIKQIVEVLREAEISCVTYYGKTSKDDREQAIDDFQAGRIKGFVAHAGAAGIGITLTAADTAIYYSCSFDNELRLQSEDRNHRIGTLRPVTYIDLVAEYTIDEDVVKSLAAKNHVAYTVIDKNRIL